MAKLNGVKAVAEAIEYNGVKYEKVDGKAQVGDIVRSNCEDVEHFPNGAFYTVVDDSYGPFVVDEDGDNYYGIVNDIDFTIFRKVSEPQAAPQQYREVNRNARDGERIKVVNPYLTGGRYKTGDVLGVASVDGDGSGDVRVVVGSERLLIARKEYVVLEPVAEQSDDIVEVDGVKYRKIGRDPKVGDFVYMLQDATGLTQGKLYEITKVGRYGGVFEDDDEDTRSFGGNSRHRQLVERIATSEDLEREVSEMKTKLAEVEAQLAEKKAEEEKARDPRSAFAAGDKVRLISGGNDHPLNGYKNGEVYTVRDPLYVYSKKIEITGGEIRTGYALPEQLVKLTEEEIAEMNRLKVGEYARVVSDKNRGGSQRTDVLVGDIAEIIEDDGSMTPFRAKLIRDGSTTRFREEALVCATDEEVAEGKAKAYKASFKVGEYARVVKDNFEHRVGHVMKISGLEDEDSHFDFKVDRLTIGGSGYIKAENIEKISAEEAEEVAQWAAIGRKVGEFKEGDLIEIVRYQSGDKTGTITVVVGVGPSIVRYKSHTSASGAYFGNNDAVKLIAPVESVVNLSASNK